MIPSRSASALRLGFVPPSRRSLVCHGPQHHLTSEQPEEVGSFSFSLDAVEAWGHGTLLNRCRLHKTKKHTRRSQSASPPDHHEGKGCSPVTV